MKSCQDILQVFYEQRGLEFEEFDDNDYVDLASSSSSHIDNDDNSDYGESNPSSSQRKSRSQTAHMLSLNTSTTKLQPLLSALSVDHLSDERDKLQVALRNAKPETRGNRNNVVTSINTVLGNMATNNSLAAMPPGVWSDGCIHLVISQVHSSLATAPGLLRQLHYLTIAQSAISWQIGRSLRLLYRWYVDTGPTLAEMLVDSLMESPEALDRRHPQFAPLVKHAYGYVKAIYAAKARKSKKKGQPSISPMSEPPQPGDFKDIPDNVLEPVISAHQLPMPKVQLFVIKEKNIKTGDNAGIEAYTQEVVLDILCQIFIHPGVNQLDLTLNKKRAGNTTPSKCVARCLLCALILEQIVEFCGGEDGILATTVIQEVIQRPSHIFEDRLMHKEDAMIKHLIRNPFGATAPLRAWLQQHKPSSPSIIAISKEIGDIVWQGACQINGGTPFLRVFQDAQKPGSQYKRKGLRQVCNNCGALIPQTDGPLLGILAAMLREKLNQIRNHPKCDEHLDRILHGKHPLTSSQSTKGGDVDHYNPIQHDNMHINLIRDNLGVNKLLTAEGIGAIVTWFLTGQGSQTVTFIKKTNMLFTTLEQAEAAFKNAQALGYTFDNTMVWGQPCSQLAVCAYSPQTKQRLKIAEKLAPFFSKELSEKWLQFLGDLAGFEGDPWAYTGYKHEWDECLAWVESLGLVGLGPGSLTALQLTNTFAILGYIKPPSAKSMAHWVTKHPGKGAYRGMVALGFDLSGRPKPLLESYVLEAFQALYHHFDTKLSQADRAATGFDRGLGVIFVEHFLCKVVRWARRFPPKGMVQLQTIGLQTQIQFKGVWKQGENLLDKTGQALPIPLTLETKYQKEMETRLQTLWSTYIKDGASDM